MGKKRLVKVYVVANTELLENIPVEGHIEFQLAYNSVRAACYTSKYLNRIRDDESSLTWDVTMAVTTALIQTSDAVLVIQDNLQQPAYREIEIAKENHKHLIQCNWKDVNDISKQLANYFRKEVLNEN